MNIKIDIELTPQELRQFIGLPDVAGIQEDMIQFVRQAVTKGVKGVESVDVDALRETLKGSRAWKRLMSLVGPEDVPRVTIRQSPRPRRKTAAPRPPRSQSGNDGENVG
jgi:hypothetical protein